MSLLRQGYDNYNPGPANELDEAVAALVASGNPLPQPARATLDMGVGTCAPAWRACSQQPAPPATPSDQPAPRALLPRS
jgi:hypothetical protein